jgi:hypothetical protein
MTQIRHLVCGYFLFVDIFLKIKRARYYFFWLKKRPSKVESNLRTMFNKEAIGVYLFWGEKNLFF